ncbi:MAG: fibrobacter succinogenes major paralogous domain-containing protein [Bacteroidales bacterium]|nr:fibrobacter succinogenes major paralogous domain-containing protein [Bacteroidales bacterium]
MKSTNFWAKLAAALVTLSLAGGALVVTSCGDESEIETPDNPDDKPDNPDDKPENPGEETTTATVTLRTPNIDGTTVTWTGKLEVKGSGTVEAGVSYSESNKPNKVGDPDIVTVQKAGTPDASGNFTITVSGLAKDKTYYYCSYCKIDDKYTFGDVIEFKTGGNVYEEEADIDMSKAEDLSAGESANCYIVTRAGTYKFQAVKGNDKSQRLSGAKAEILWESFCTEEMPAKGSIVSGVCSKDGYVGFTTPATYTKGNALVALKDADGNIIWSWHIWLTDQPAEHVYRNNAGTMMDRNLGATEAKPAYRGVIGFIYQWGRKDPFLNSADSETFIMARSTGDSNDKVVSCTSNTGNIEYAIAHPQYFISANKNFETGKGNCDWLFDEKTDYTIKEKTRWLKDKTIYDPCPAGWRVPDGGSEGIWVKSGFDNTFKDNASFNGISFPLDNGTNTWYPAPGHLSYIGDRTTGSVGRYWSATLGSETGYYFRIEFGSDSPIDPKGRWNLSAALSVRCQKIQ